MAYIKFRLNRTADRNGRTLHTGMTRIGSDMDSTGTIQPNFIYHAMANHVDMKTFMILDEGVLDRDMMMGAEAMLLDVGVLDCDTLF